MEIFVPYSSLHYAIIEASKKDRPKRLVIAYHDEACLRDLIAAPSILGSGFASREEAMENVEDLASVTPRSKQKSRIGEMFHSVTENRALVCGNGLVIYSRIPQRILQSIFAVVIAIFYSKNIVSVIIRMALGASL